METTPDSAPAARRLRLRLLICNPKSYGAKNIVVKGRGGDIPRTREDPYLPGLYSYECKTHTEWRDIGVAISKQVSNQNCLFAHAHFVDLDQPAGPTARVELVPGGVYADGSADTPVRSQYTLDCIAATLKAYAGIPATAENLQECLDRITTAVRGPVVTPAPIIAKQQEGSEPSIAPSLEAAGEMPAPITISPSSFAKTAEENTDEGSQSGSAGEALEEPESTLSAADTETQPSTPEGSAGTPARPDTANTQEPPVAVPAAKPAPAASKPKPATKPAPAAKKKK